MTHPTHSQPSYLDTLRADWGSLGLWDYLRYDVAGDLWINDLRVIDAVHLYGTPLEIVDATLVERRAREWQALAQAVAGELGYPGRLRYLYAAKANMASEVTSAAYRSGWHAETSGPQDLRHLMWLKAQGLLPEGLRVVCNGFKLPLACHGWPATGPVERAGPVVLPPLDHAGAATDPRNRPYVEMILDLAREGWDITPVLDTGELESFLAADVPEMDLGLRLKFGRAQSFAELDALVSRFGMDRRALAATAAQIAATDHLRFTMLHAMVGAAETIPVDDFVASLKLAGQIWAELRHAHPSLIELNIGGGIPPLGEAYDHRRFLTELMSALMAVCHTAHVRPPDLTFEFGSLIAAEAGFHVFKVMQLKRNHVPDAARSSDSVIESWAIVDGGLMAAIPDMLLIGKPFRFLAVQGAHAPAGRVRLGDVTCDSDGRYPPKAFGPDAAVWLPEPTADAPTYVLIQGVGAYQEILAGVRGAHHCGLLEAVELIVERGADGITRGRLMPRQTPEEAKRMLGYNDAAIDALERALRA
jgi:diaminopimelate decarboxylase